jgi:hypothetical protein
VVWFMSYQHSLRPDEAGVKFACDQSEAAAEKLRMESRGYVVARVAQSLHAVAPLGEPLSKPVPVTG